jgi:hypothetical protein
MSKVTRESNNGVEDKRTLIRHQLGMIREELENEHMSREENMRVLT